MQYLISFIFGLVEGITEWLPISSTGHMLLLNEFIRLDVRPVFWELFLVVIQLGAILAVCVLYFKQLNFLSPRLSREERRAKLRLWGYIILACLPAAIIGIPLDNLISEVLSSPFVIAAALIVWGIIFILVENRKPKAGAKHKKNQETVESIEELDLKRALGIGVFQLFSLIPGTSRSGSTIVGGLILGCSRTVAAEFTFFLAIPVMFGASLLRCAKFFLKGNVLSSNETAILAVATISAFVVSVVAIKFLVAYVKKHNFKPFAWYRIVLGLLCFAWFGSQYLL